MATTANTALPTELDTMREVAEAFVPIERAAGQPQPVRWVVKHLSVASAHNAHVEEAPFYDGYPRLHAKLKAFGVAVSVAGLLS